MSDETKLNLGGLVRLKSGGPTMTVCGFFDTNGKIDCQWFAGDKLRRADFFPDAVELVEEDD